MLISRLAARRTTFDYFLLQVCGRDRPFFFPMFNVAYDRDDRPEETADAIIRHRRPICRRKAHRSIEYGIY